MYPFPFFSVTQDKIIYKISKNEKIREINENMIKSVNKANTRKEDVEELLKF
jgi:hypothetical protein